MQSFAETLVDAASATPLNEAVTPLAVPAVLSPIRLACAEVGNFRRLAQTRLDFDDCTTVLVGANNSGKTSLLIALRNFLSESPGFRAFDIGLAQWSTLRQLGEVWEAIDEDPTTDTKDADAWEHQHQQLLACMPFVDLWFDAKEGAYHYVAPFINTLKWSGGAVGLRLRLEPVSDSSDLRKLAWRYREARVPVRNLAKKGHAWPTDLLDYWLRHPADLRRIQAYRLDPAKGPLQSPEASAPQPLPPSSQPVELALLRQLIRVDFVPAQRGLGAEDDEARSEPAGARPGLFSNQLVKFARQHLNVNASAHGHSEALVEAIANAQASLDERIFEALQPSMQDVRILGYPGLHDPQGIHFRTRIKTADLLAHSTAIQYCNDETALNELLPEHSIGLGYQNLQSLSFMLVSFRTARLNPTQGTPAAVHLVMVEEPEAHLHVQVQRCFSTNAHALLCPKGAEQSHLHTQLLISTHSSHLAHGNKFTRLRYVKRTLASAAGAKPSTRVINLATVFGSDEQTRTFAERYFEVQHTDLLFADAAVFVEGAAERMLVPQFIARDFQALDRKYLSFLDIGGSHAHRLRPLVECLGIPTVVITDVDPVVPQKVRGRTVKVAVCIAGQSDLECGNDTLTVWHPKLTNFQEYGTPKAEDLEWTSPNGGKVRFAWQVPIPSAGGQWPSSFEDALVLSNIDWFKQLDEEKDPVSGKKVKHSGTLGKVIGLAVDYPNPTELAQQLHDMMHRGFSKGDFAATLFERFNKGSFACPSYIAEALDWLSKQLHGAGASA
ncbi:MULTISPECIES: AAA family ATPase [Azospirillum]|uniref:AAA family ATPase n=1 Tax=Azospirillum brasilense TaxID=192 RepID=A0A0P0EFR3_AZOBR|nr:MULTISPECIES: AAA family ATPase [Azospirillum]ALJ34448.1 ATP-dependent endonuclease [Azospirillum brasilense]MDW7557914.1 AAA family ATPase [Azospirillum brasilense]MDW7597503.1 AAA family ATPase [Azospirillum brasilense]MDW7632731.1 AAA family ATPase [Azospirillum brasilense]MDX5953068.1 AAA family ATPase [Azospirillum brasilense]